MGCTAEELAAVTAEDAFKEADLDHDGQLTFEEFQKWYKYLAPTADGLAEVEDLVPEWVSHAEVRRLTNLEAFGLDDIVDRFSDVAAEDKTVGPLDPNELMIGMALMDRDTTLEDQDKLRVVLVKMFELFDEDRNGRIDIKELATGLSVLAGGNRDAKTKCAFTL